MNIEMTIASSPLHDRVFVELTVGDRLVAVISHEQEGEYCFEILPDTRYEGITVPLNDLLAAIEVAKSRLVYNPPSDPEAES